jgi:hypothetical protein
MVKYCMIRLGQFEKSICCSGFVSKHNWLMDWYPLGGQCLLISFSCICWRRRELQRRSMSVTSIWMSSREKVVLRSITNIFALLKIKCFLHECKIKVLLYKATSLSLPSLCLSTFFLFVFISTKGSLFVFLVFHFGILLFNTWYFLMASRYQCYGSRTFWTDPDPKFDIRVFWIRFRILLFFQHAWRALVLHIFNVHKTFMVLYYMFKSKQVNC